ncbi:peptidylprolyl isomerase [Gemmatimonadota bacterium Y43]|uniref:peptidylprolyl isomerase n=1 Tax=Gaopeijia maritima TaxID=3119007 RepID=UPI0032827F21
MKTFAMRAGTLAALLWVAACGDDTGSEGVLARAENHTFTVEEAVRLLAGQPDLPNEPQVVTALADLWVDYTLLARQLSQDSTLASLEVGPMLQGRLEQEMILALRDSVILADTVMTEDELRELFVTYAPGAQVRARHILFGFPLQATDAERDSVRAEAQTIRDRIAAGESFEDLARQYSQDPGSASSGGDLGFFRRDEMVEPFAVAAFELEPGELSEVVETPMGFHVIRTEEKETPAFEDVAPQFRQQMIQMRSVEAESLYVATMAEEAGLTIEDDVAEVVRRIVETPDIDLSRGARGRVLVRYQGGTLTVGELQTFMQAQLPEGRAQLAQQPDSVLVENVLQGLTQRELLVAEAEEQGFERTEAYVDSLSAAVKVQLREAAMVLGLAPIQPEGTESMEQAIDRTVEALLRRIVSGQQDVIPLGMVATGMRQSSRAQVFPMAAIAVVQGVARVRGPAPAPAASPIPAPTPGGAAGDGAGAAGGQTPDGGAGG